MRRSAARIPRDLAERRARFEHALETREDLRPAAGDGFDEFRAGFVDFVTHGQPHGIFGLLEEANLVAIVWRGREKLHFLNPVPLQDIYDRWIEKFERHRLTALRELKRTLEGQDDEQE